MAGVDLVLNPHARRLYAGGARRREVLDGAQRERVRVHEPTSFRQLEQLARELASREARVVLLAGGDGTLMRGLSALANAFGPAPLPIVGVVPAGTVGTVARHLGLGGASVGAVVRAACSCAPSSAPRSTMRLRDGREPARVGFIFGAGLVARFFDTYLRSKRPGLTTAALVAARAFAGSLVGARFAARLLAPVACTLTVDGGVHEARAWSLVVASVVRDLGLHLRLTYRAGSDAERFHVVASGLSASALGPQMPRVIAGRPLRGQPNVDALARMLRLEFESGEGSYVLDGDVFRAGSVTLEPGPAVRVLTLR